MVNYRILADVGATKASLVTYLVAVVAVTVGFGVLVGCGDDGGGSSASCEPARREAADPNSAVHVLPGAADPTYLSDPPTSGPHQVGRRLSGVVDEPVPRPVQVGALEAGQVLLQHRGLSEDDVAALAALASDDVIVAPNPDLPAAVVATAWLFKQECSGVDIAELEQFIADRVGQGPGSDA